MTVTMTTSISAPRLRPRRQSTRPRDSQRQKLYDAERAAFASDPSIARFKNVDQCQEYVDRITSARWFQSRWGRMYVPVLSGKGCHARYRGGITLSRYGYTPWVVLHELAHVLVSSAAVAAHGTEFASCYLLLVGQAMGPDYATALRQSFAKHRVRWHGGRAAIPAAGTKRVVTASQKAADARERAQRPIGPEEARRAAEIIRRAARSGSFGPSSRKPRVHALETARLLEGLA